MLVVIIKRLLLGVALLFILTVLVFFGVYAVGNPVDVLVPEGATSVERERVISNLGLDKPKYVQYFIFLRNASRGKFGNSFVTGEAVSKTFLNRLGATLELAFAACLFAILIGIPIGLHAGLNPHTKLSKIGMASMTFSFALPMFWIAMVLIMVFAVRFQWFPPGRRGAIGSLLGMRSSLFTLDGLKHIVLPSFCLSLPMMSLLARMTRTTASEILHSEHVLFARAKGVPSSAILLKHILRNILIPLVTIAGTQIANIIAFAAVIETIFNWPGIGKLLIDSIHALDRPAILMQLMFTAVLFIFVNLIVDLLYAALDPRILDTYRGGGS